MSRRGRGRTPTGTGGQPPFRPLTQGRARANTAPVVETRAYRSPRRDAQARLTRRRVLEAATASFLARGYAGTTMRAVAGGAGVSVATVELLFGTKVALLQAAIDVAIAGDDEPVAVLDRAWADAARRAGPRRRCSPSRRTC